LWYKVIGYGLGFRVKGVGFGVQGLEVSGYGLWVMGYGFRAYSLRCRV
jgi:hypothetical protein